MSVFTKLRQCFCKHKYSKRYDRKDNCYKRQCVKCGKVE